MVIDGVRSPVPRLAPKPGIRGVASRAEGGARGLAGGSEITRPPR